MVLLIPLAVLLFLATPFAMSGYRHYWKAALGVELIIAGFAGYLWSLPIDPAEDFEIAQAWRLFVLCVASCCGLAFIAGYCVSRFSRPLQNGKEELE